MWTCSRCNRLLDEVFQACWFCGAPRDRIEHDRNAESDAARVYPEEHAPPGDALPSTFSVRKALLMVAVFAALFGIFRYRGTQGFVGGTITGLAISGILIIAGKQDVYRIIVCVTGFLLGGVFGVTCFPGGVLLPAVNSSFEDEQWTVFWCVLLGGTMGTWLMSLWIWKKPHYTRLGPPTMRIEKWVTSRPDHVRARSTRNEDGGGLSNPQ